MSSNRTIHLAKLLELISLANFLTAVRLLLAIPVCVGILNEEWLFCAVTLFICLITDIFDGKMARRAGSESTFGGLFDHGTDAFFVTCALGVISTEHYLTPVLPLLIPLAFTQYLLDSRKKESRGLKASFLGKANGIAYSIPICLVVGAGLFDWSWPYTAAKILAWVLVATTILSMLDRLIRFTRK